MKKQSKETTIDNFIIFETSNLSSIYGGTVAKGGVLNAAIGKNNEPHESVGKPNPLIGAVAGTLAGTEADTGSSFKIDTEIKGGVLTAAIG